jgi:hypothetical protein
MKRFLLFLKIDRHGFANKEPLFRRLKNLLCVVGGNYHENCAVHGLRDFLRATHTGTVERTLLDPSQACSHKDSTPVRLPFVLSPPVLATDSDKTYGTSSTRESSHFDTLPLPVCSFQISKRPIILVEEENQ